jgi:hypothetical protein
MKKYKFKVGKRILWFESKTMGGAMDKAIHWWKKNSPCAERPVYQNIYQA